MFTLLRPILLGLLCAMVLWQYPKTAEAQFAEVLGPLTVGQLVEQGGEQLTRLIQQAEQSGDFLAARAAQEALFVLDGFERANKNLLGTLFENIGRERQAVLNQINKTTADIEHGRIDSLSQLEQAADQIDRLVRDKTTFGREPVVFRYRGTIVVPGETQNLRLSVSGSHLTGGAPFLEFREQRYAAKKDGESLRFELPRVLFDSEESEMKSENAKLVLEGRKGGLLGFFTTAVAVEYDLNIVTLPKNLATVEVTYEEEVSYDKERTVVIDENHNSSSKKWDCRGFAFSPAAADRRFDVDRSFVKPTDGNSRGKLQDVRVKETGISFSLCAKRGYTDKDNGYRHAKGKYVEVWKSTGQVPKVESRPLRWTENAVIPVGDRTSRLIVYVTDFSGVRKRYAAVRFDPDSKAVIVDPITPTELRSL